MKEFEMTPDEESMQSRSYFPELLKDKIREGNTTIEIRISANTAYNLANDVAFAVKHRPLGVTTDDLRDNSMKLLQNLGQEFDSYEDSTQ